MITRYNRKVRIITHHIDDLVMIFQKNIDKFQVRWRGSFRISGYGGSHERFFILL